MRYLRHNRASRPANRSHRLIYLDSAATSFYKPPTVARAMQKAMRTCAGYARGGHTPAMHAAEVVFDCRSGLAQLFGTTPDCVMFTLNATHALNYALHALCTPQTKVAVTGYEHNAVMRPLYAREVPYIVLQSAPFDTQGMLEAAKDAIEQGVQLFVVNHVSNVYGSIAPLIALDALLSAHGIGMVVDASQSAGHVAIDLSQLPSVKALCTAGHKGLLGPMGTGVLIVPNLQQSMPWEPLIYGGTGSLSAQFAQPDIYPDRLESGTPNVVGIAGLGAGVRYLLSQKVETMQAHTQQLLRHFCTTIAAWDAIDASAIRVLYDPTFANQSGVVSVTSSVLDVDTLADLLAEQGICTRAGLHCAPLAHTTGDTLDTGTLRFSFGYGNTLAQVDGATRTLRTILHRAIIEK